MIEQQRQEMNRGKGVAMSLNVSTDSRYDFDTADRIRRAMRVADVSVQELAEALEVNRNTIGNWINGRRSPKRRDLAAIALRTGFSIEWLETGKTPDPEPDGGLSESRLSESNRRPIHYKSHRSPGRVAALAPIRDERRAA